MAQLMRGSSAVKPWVKPKQVHQGRYNQAFYNSPRWRKDRLLHLGQNPVCLNCEASGVVVEASVSDHIQPIRLGGHPWDWSNRQALCKPCHDAKSGREASLYASPPDGRGEGGGNL